MKIRLPNDGSSKPLDYKKINTVVEGGVTFCGGWFICVSVDDVLSTALWQRVNENTVPVEFIEKAAKENKRSQLPPTPTPPAARMIRDGVGPITPDATVMWVCAITGQFNHACYYRIEEGKQPNRFHRWMQRLLLGFVWYQVLSNGERVK